MKNLSIRIATNHTAIALLATLLLIGCRSGQLQKSTQRQTFFPAYESLSAADRKKADSVLIVALDQEALYTLTARLKPMSSIGFSLRYYLGKDSTQQDGDARVVNVSTDSVQQMLVELTSWHRIAKALSFGDFKFVVIPFKQVYKKQRYMELLVCRQSLIDSVVQVHQSFFGQWGFTPGIDPHTLITTIEFEGKQDRYRAYGYLFGYPAHAVDFFVEAGKEYERTKKMVKRDFFHIPTFSRPEGHFTYAVPLGYQPSKIDSAIYKRGAAALAIYKQKRNGYLQNGRLNAVNYLRSTLPK